MSTPLMRVCAVKGMSVAPESSRSRRLKRSLARTTIERPSGVSSARLESCAASASCSSVTPGSGRNSAACRLPSVIVPVLSSSSVEQSPAASTARPDRASTLCCTRRSMPAMPIAESSAPIVVGMRHTSSAASTMHVLARLRVHGERLQRGHGDQEDDGEARQEDVERDLVGRLLARGPLDERDHAVEEARARLLRHAHDDLVGEDARAAGDRGAVAARLADHGSRLAGDRRLVDGGDALDDLSVGRDELPGRDHDHVAERQTAGRDVLEAAVLAATVSDRLGARAAKRLGLGLAPALGHRLREVREQHREPEPRGDGPGEHGRARGWRAR